METRGTVPGHSVSSATAGAIVQVSQNCRFVSVNELHLIGYICWFSLKEQKNLAWESLEAWGGCQDGYNIPI